MATLPQKPDFSANDKLITLAGQIVEVLDKRCKAGCSNPDWTGYENGNGSEVGSEIERLIRRAKRILRINSLLHARP